MKTNFTAYTSIISTKYNGINHISRLLSIESFADPLGAQTIEYHNTPVGGFGGGFGSGLSDNSSNISKLALNDLNSHSQNNSEDDIGINECETNLKIDHLFNNGTGNGHKTFRLQDEYETNAMVLHYSVQNKTQQGIGGELDECITSGEYGRVLQLDLNNKIRMVTLGLHNNPYSFNDVILLQKSYVNANQLHIFVKSKMKDYWREFISVLNFLDV